VPHRIRRALVAATARPAWRCHHRRACRGRARGGLRGDRGRGVAVAVGRRHGRL